MPKLVNDAERSRKRQAILDAAATEIARFGYDRANINTIAERAGIGRGTIYLYFESKDDVLNALLDAVGALIDDTVRACIELSEPWPERLRVLTRSFVALASDHRDFFRVQVSALHGVNRDIGAPLARWLSASATRLSQAFQRAVECDEIQSLPPDTLATLVLGALESLALLPNALEQSETAALERADTLAALLWRGMAPS